MYSKYEKLYTKLFFMVSDSLILTKFLSANKSSYVRGILFLR